MSAEGMSAGIFGAPRSARGGYRIMWKRAEGGLPPVSFDVEPRRR